MRTLNSPTINSFLVNGIGTSGTAEILAGTNLVVTASITEDIEMDSYQVQVVADFTPAVGTPFSYDQTTSATGLAATVNETITIPASAIAGPYNVIITATDAAGRESELTITISITNPTQATIDVTSPTANFIISFSDTIVMVGSVTDDDDIVSIDFVGRTSN